MENKSSEETWEALDAALSTENSLVLHPKYDIVLILKLTAALPGDHVVHDAATPVQRSCAIRMRKHANPRVRAAAVTLFPPDDSGSLLDAIDDAREVVVQRGLEHMLIAMNNESTNLSYYKCTFRRLRDLVLGVSSYHSAVVRVTAIQCLMCLANVWPVDYGYRIFIIMAIATVDSILAVRIEAFRHLTLFAQEKYDSYIPASSIVQLTRKDRLVKSVLEDGELGSRMNHNDNNTELKETQIMFGEKRKDPPASVDSPGQETRLLEDHDGDVVGAKKDTMSPWKEASIQQGFIHATSWYGCCVLGMEDDNANARLSCIQCLYAFVSHRFTWVELDRDDLLGLFYDSLSDENGQIRQFAVDTLTKLYRAVKLQLVVPSSSSEMEGREGRMQLEYVTSSERLRFLCMMLSRPCIMKEDYDMRISLCTLLATVEFPDGNTLSFVLDALISAHQSTVVAANTDTILLNCIREVCWGHTRLLQEHVMVNTWKQRVLTQLTSINSIVFYHGCCGRSTEKCVAYLGQDMTIQLQKNS